MSNLTNTVYLPRQDARQGAGTERRQINLVGMNRHPEHVMVGGMGVCNLCVLWHAQIMTSDAAPLRFGAPVFSEIALLADLRLQTCQHGLDQ